MDRLPKRKVIRLRHYDYRSNGVYHVTICARQNQCIFGRIDGGKMILNDMGEIADADMLSIPRHYPNVDVVAHVVMPNHVHLLIGLRETADAMNGVPTGRRSIGQIVGAYKAGVSRKVGHQVWQPLYYDHIIRGERDLLDTIAYIENNPAAWDKDEYYG